MSMIDRYRKPGGFVQLLNLIETTGKDKQEKFLKMISDENPTWEAEVRKRVLTVEKILSWNPTYLAEIFPRVPALQLAMLIGGLPKDKSEAFLALLGYTERRRVEEILKDKTPTPGETTSGATKLFEEIRKMEAEGTLKFEKFDPEMVIPDDIEEKLGQGVSILPLTKTADNVSTDPGSAPAHGGGGVPPALLEEMSMLRRKLVVLSQENNKLQTENHEMKEKLERIRKIA
ncbi:MAG: hypothetical protein COT73_09050 [Bdellovibrio sp. CG10_big_fil_rev_8_21_14_0_10_47_8]|nr:MAG: hypothetical protein COT73_09050 [Bdellovibrio sp. CG10_big_fil_rev_8_21_14_0_10_47_8]